MIRISKEVEHALKNKIPVVALESTIISHGMPYPKNVQTALRVEAVVRENGAIPATIGIIDGVGIIGMSEDQIEEFGKKTGIIKVSRRDLPVVFAKKIWGATTVASTMILANAAGIEVFVTGGIGGVHRKAQETFDVSADLQELAKTNVTVVCAGAKAILDLPLTLEYLETHGVPVLGFKTDELPDFYTPKSGLKLDYQSDSEEEIAKIIFEKRAAKLDGGIVIANPIDEEHAMNKQEINQAISDALIKMEQQGIHGKESTPFLLKNVAEITKGKSLESNIQLILNNARLGAKIAKEYAKLK